MKRALAGVLVLAAMAAAGCGGGGSETHTTHSIYSRLSAEQLERMINEEMQLEHALSGKAWKQYRETH